MRKKYLFLFYFIPVSLSHLRFPCSFSAYVALLPLLLHCCLPEWASKCTLHGNFKLLSFHRNYVYENIKLNLSLSRVSLHGMLVHEASNIHRSSKHRRDERERSHPIEFHSFCLQLVYKYFPSKLNSINKQGDEIMMRMESEDIDKAHIFMTADSIGPTQKMIERGLHITKIQNVPHKLQAYWICSLLRWRENAQERRYKV